ncbi:ketopantoate reductase family protein [Minwuia sp.]|uniref:ketopantoate reductase family protein n=1 Tax=Minwuia sp. TaxID=2493630 RepID=UPI003A90267E
MKIAVIGTGAMGSVYAALLADAGNDVRAIDVWQAHVDAINADGLTVGGASGSRTVRTVSASTDIADAGQCDLYIIATKASGVGDAARSVAGVMGPDSIVLTIQNGLGAGERIARYMPTDRVLLGVAAGFGASMKGPGHAHHNAMSLIRIGEINGGLSERVEKIASVWRDAGFNVKAYADIEQLVWEKYICNSTFSAPCTVFDCTIGELMAAPDLWAIGKGCALEIHALGLAKGVNFSFDDPIAYVTAFGENMPDARPSMLLDHHARRPSEIDAINGMAEVLGAQFDIATPFNQAMTAVVRHREKAFRTP